MQKYDLWCFVSGIAGAVAIAMMFIIGLLFFIFSPHFGSRPTGTTLGLMFAFSLIVSIISSIGAITFFFMEKRRNKKCTIGFILGCAEAAVLLILLIMTLV